MKLTQQEHNTLNKPSILVNIAHEVDISLNALKVYNFIIRELFKQDIEYNTIITTTFSKIAESLNYNSKHSSLQILDYLIELEECRIRTKTWNYSRNDWKDNLITTLISAIIYNEEDNTLKIEISQSLRDLILKYRDTFAKLDLEELKKIKSKHTLKLYELFKDYSYHKNHKMNVELTDLLDYLNIPKESPYRNNISIFNRNILKKSINEINSKSYMNVEYKYYRANKSNNKAYYSFSIQDIRRYTFNRFKATMLELNKIRVGIFFHYKKSTYEIELIENKNRENYMLINASTGKTLETELAKELWEYIYYQSNYNTLDFFEESHIDFEEFNTIYENLKRREKNQKNKKTTHEQNKKINKKEEIIIHENQTTLEDF